MRLYFKIGIYLTLALFTHSATAADDLPSESYPKIIKLETQLKQNPQLLSLHLQLADLYYQHQNYKQALEHIRQLLQHNAIPAQVRQNAEKFKQRLHTQLHTATANKTQIKHSLKFYTGYDNNANAGSEDLQIDAGILPNELLSRADQFSGFIYDLNYQQQDVQPLIPLSLQGKWEMDAQLTLLNKTYHTEDSSNLNILRLNSGLHFNNQINWKAGLKLEWDYIEIDNQHIAAYTLFSPRFTYQLEKHFISINPKFIYRDFKPSSLDNQSGWQQQLALYDTLAISPQTRLRLGVSITERDMQQDYNRYTSTQLSLNISHYFSPRLQMKWQTTYEKFQYQAVEPLYADKREDRFLISQLIFNYQYQKNIGFALKYGYQKRRSNHQLHEYQRSQILTEINFKF